MDRFRNIPLFLVLTGLMSLAMYLPAVHGLVNERFAQSRAFFYTGTLGLFATTLITIALSGRPRKLRGGLGDLAALLAAFSVLPLVLAVPFQQALGTTSFLNAYVEMVSSLTTTGATLFDPNRLSGTLHLWRATVGWFGGLVMWLAAAAILAPLSLGGFEVTATAEPGQADTPANHFEHSDANRRLQRSARQLVPIYTALTVVLWLCLTIAGDTPLVGLIHAMSTMATSGITPLSGLEQSTSGIAGEALMFLFMFFALSRLTFASDTTGSLRPGLWDDAEFRMGLALVAGVPVVLFARHWWGAFDVDDVENTGAALRALWGSVFTVLSFLTTNGFESVGWTDARNWSGLESPGLILLGLSLMGGGVATTAGGVKLLRVYALYLAGVREMRMLVHPSSVGHSTGQNRRIRRKGAFVAWVFFMMFALALTAVTALLTALGTDFEDALILAVAALSTTGPLLQAATEAPIAIADLGPLAKLILSAAMVLGRFETLAIIALFNPSLWRD